MSNWIPKHYTGSPCEVCGITLTENNTYPRSSPICDACRENTPKKELERKWAEIRKREGRGKEEVVIPQEENVPLVLRRNAESDKSRIIIWVFVGVLALWLISSMISSRGDSSKVYIDCRQPGWENSPYCDGTFEGEIRDQDGIENNFYQNIVR